MFKTTTDTPACALAALLIAGAAQPSYAGTTRDHRGTGAALQPPPQNACLSAGFKYCAKTGTIIRDHRTK